MKCQFSSYWLAFIVLEGGLQLPGREKLTVFPSCEPHVH